MSVKKTLGGDRIGSESKMQVELHDFERSTHDLGRVWKSSMAPGVLYPFIARYVQDDDICEIDLSSMVRTIPTNGPLFGSFKLQLELYHCPIRLYNGVLHNNAQRLGLNMGQVKMPKIQIAEPQKLGITNNIGKSTLLHYMGICDLPYNTAGVEKFTALKELMYYDIIKNYHVNQQEDTAFVIGGSQSTNTGNGSTVGVPPNNFYIVMRYDDGSEEITAEAIGDESYTQNFIHTVYSQNQGTTKYSVIISPGVDETIENPNTSVDSAVPMLISTINATANTSGYAKLFINIKDMRDDIKAAEIEEMLGRILIGARRNVNTETGITAMKTYSYNLSEFIVAGSGKIYTRTNTEKAPAGKYFGVVLKNMTQAQLNESGWKWSQYGFVALPIGYTNLPLDWSELFSTQPNQAQISTGVAPFPIENLDKARWTILSNQKLGTEVVITSELEPDAENVINWLPYCTSACGSTPTAFDLQKLQIPMNGLMLKCYLSDVNNNWLNKEIIDGETGINAITGVQIVNGEFTIDALNLANKVYNVLNRIAVAGGTYEDWREAVFGNVSKKNAESPIYIGGASGEVVFEEVISNNTGSEEPLGTLGGRGNLGKFQGGYVRYHAEEAGYVIGLASLTPRLDYSQGIEWDSRIDNMDQWHKPGLDGIGWQNLMAWTLHGAANPNLAIGKQPAWVNYTTAKNEAHGDFADENKAMYMTLNRRYQIKSIEGANGNTIDDATTYIDPAKYNYAFADTEIDSQNFWVQIGISFKIRSKMSASQIPNL